MKKTTQISKRIMDVVMSSKCPMTSKEIAFEVYNKITENNIRYTNKVLKFMRDINLAGYVDGAPRKYSAVRKNPLQIDACACCHVIKNTTDIGSDGLCSDCRNLSEEKDVLSSGGKQRVSDSPKVRMSGFGNTEPTQIPVNPARQMKHISILNMMKGQHCRIIADTSGTRIYGELKEVHPDGFIGIQTSYGPSLINSNKIVSIEPFTKNREDRH